MEVPVPKELAPYIEQMDDNLLVQLKAKELNVPEQWDHVRPGDKGNSALAYRGDDIWYFMYNQDEDDYKVIRFKNYRNVPRLEKFALYLADIQNAIPVAVFPIFNN